MIDINIDSEKKLLIKLVFKKAGEESLKTAKSSKASYLSDEANVGISTRGLVRYYDEIIIKNNVTYEIDRVSLDKLSEYLGYKDFKDFYEKNKVGEGEPHQEQIETEEPMESQKEANNPQESPSEEKERVKSTQNQPQTFISIHQENSNHNTAKNTAQFETALGMGNTKDAQKKNGSNTLLYMLYFSGVLGILLAGTAVYKWPTQEKENLIEEKAGIVNIPCALWKNDHYESLPCSKLKPRDEVIYYDEYIRNFKKITRPDTLTMENSRGKVWYDKSNNKFEFFTNYGIHPENGKTLKPVTDRILGK